MKDLGARERALLNLYVNCQLQMAPADFYARWNVTHAQMAQICGCSESTVDRWFLRGAGHQPAKPLYQRRLAEIDLLWECYEQIPSDLQQRLCPDRRNHSS